MPDYNCFNKGTFNFEKIGFESEYNHSNRFHQSMKKKLSKFLNKLEFHKAESKFFIFSYKKEIYIRSWTIHSGRERCKLLYRKI